MTNEIVTQNQAALAMQQETHVADVCRDLVKKTAVNIQGKKYVQVEGWQSIATAHGCIAGSNEPQKVEGDESGYKAEGYVRHMESGKILSTAWGFVGDDEVAWANRPVYARQAMAQTRAISRACRSAFAHVITMIDTSLKTTPAEEVPAEGFTEAKPKKQRPASMPKPVEAIETPEGSWADVILHFGKNSGKRLGELTPRQLGWYVENWKPNPDYEISEDDLALQNGLEEYKKAVESQNTEGAEQLAEAREVISNATASVVEVVADKPSDDDVPF